jgi:hypothetical protein
MMIIWGMACTAVFFMVYLLLLILATKFEVMQSWEFSVGLIFIFLLLGFYGLIPFVLTDKRGNGNAYYGSAFVVIFIIAGIVASNIDNNHLDVETIGLQTSGTPRRIESFVQQFRRLHPAPAAMDTSGVGLARVPVFFIAANGGGTMQAYWTASVISYLREATSYQIDDYIFAMSGASGGAEGMAINIMAWGERTKPRTVVKQIYSHDYLTAGMAMMFGTDLWASVLPFNMQRLPNRSEWFREKYGRHLNDYLHHTRWSRPYREVWDDTSTWTPMYFANTTQAENGERWIASPCGMTDELGVYTSGISLLDRLSKDHRDLQFGDAVLLSSRFPYISTAGKIDGLGHFIDGGYHDNSGIETLLEIYNAVESSLFSDQRFYPAVSGL